MKCSQYLTDNTKNKPQLDYNFPLQVDTQFGLKIEVWDEDLNFDDELGSCVTYLTQGSHTFTCPAKKGGVEVKYSLSCDPYLTGDRCDSYMAGPVPQ